MTYISLWAPAQRKRATMLLLLLLLCKSYTGYNILLMLFIFLFFMAALFSGPGERRFAKVLHVVDLECH